MTQEGEWTSAKVNGLIGALLVGEYSPESEELVQELYSALCWTFQQYRVVRGMVAEIVTIVAPDTIPTIDGDPSE